MCDSKIQKKITNEIVEKAEVEEVNKTVSEKVFYLLHG